MISEADVDWKEVLEQIISATYFFRLPPPGFDPRCASDADLEKYGLPPRPDRDTQPVRYAFWHKMFTPANSEQVSFVEAMFEYELGEVKRIPPERGVPGDTGRESSLNWSGAYITPRDGRMFTEVHGSWTIPDVKPPLGAQRCDEFRCSTWLGLDGQRRYVESSLPQIGTSQFVQITDGPQCPITAVWWQWWLRDALNPPPITLPLPVEPGHEVMASLFVVDRTRVNYLIANRTTGVVCTPFIGPEPTSYLPPPVPPGPVRVSGATAEWVTERPTVWLSGGRLYDLPDYGQVDFTDCHVVSRTSLRPHDRQQDERTEQPVGARLINMYTVKENPHRAATISVTERTESGGVSSIRTSYRDPA
jgi:Peptidase A4 family